MTTNSTVAKVTSSLSAITLDVDTVNSPTKSQRRAEGIKERCASCRLSTEIPFSFKGTNRLKVKGWKNTIFHSNRNQKIAILKSNKTDYKSKMLNVAKEDNTLIKGSIHQ